MHAPPCRWPEHYGHHPADLDAAAQMVARRISGALVPDCGQHQRLALALAAVRRLIWQRAHPAALTPLMQVALAGVLHARGAPHDDALARAVLNPACWRYACAGDGRALAAWCRRVPGDCAPDARPGQLIDCHA